MNREARDKQPRVEQGLEPPEPPEVTCKGYGPPPPEDVEAWSSELTEEDTSPSERTQ